MKIINSLKLENDYFMNYIYLYVFLMPWNFFNGQMGSLSLILFVWWLIIGKARGYFVKLKELISFKPLVLIIIFFIYCYISLLWTNNLSASRDSLDFYKYYWILIPTLFTALDREKCLRLIYILIITFSLYGIFSILIYLEIIYINFSPSYNPRGILPYSIVTLYMGIGFLTSILFIFMINNKKIKILLFIFSLICLIGIFINNGRAGQLSFFITTLILMFIYKNRIFNFKGFALIFSILLVSIYLLNFNDKFNEFNKGINELKSLEKSNFYGSWGHRAYMWYAATEIIKKDPIFGTGAGDNIDEFIKYTKKHPSKATWLRSFHNQHLDTLTRYGIFGYSIFILSIILLIYSLKGENLFFPFSIIFFSITLIAGLADIILLMKPYNNIFMLVFIILSVVAYNKEKQIKKTVFNN